MRIIFIPAMAAVVFAFSSFILPVNKAKAPSNSWSYEGKEFHADSSGWSNRNNYQIDFMQLDGKTKPMSICISASFLKKPLNSGTYRFGLFPRLEDEVSIYAADKDNVYMSMGCEDCTAHVEVTNGKLHIWSDRVVMSLGPGINDSTTFAFNVFER